MVEAGHARNDGADGRAAEGVDVRLWIPNEAQFGPFDQKVLKGCVSSCDSRIACSMVTVHHRIGHGRAKLF